MITPGIRGKLGFTLGGMAVLFLLTAGAGYNMLGKFELDQARITNVIVPMNNAAYEMEINMAEVGLRVMKYLQLPDKGQLDLIAEDVAEFKQFNSAYAGLAFTAEQKALAVDAGRIFSLYVSIGNRLIEGKDLFSSQANALARSFMEIEVVVDHARAQAPLDANSQTERLLRRLRAEMSEAAGLLSIAALAADRGGITVLETEMAKIQLMMSNYMSDHGGSKPALAVQEKFTQALDLLGGLAQTLSGQEKNFQQFVAHRRQLDDLLDEEIQIKSAAYLQSLNAGQHEAVMLSIQLLLYASALWAAMTAGALWFVSHDIVSPLRKLAVMAESLNAGGDLSHRTGITGGDELGALARAFDSMAERLQSAYGRLSETNAELDSIVAERTHELAAANARLNEELDLRKRTEVELRAAVAAANAANDAKTLFLGNMSHELRTPLNAIIGFSEIIKTQMFGPAGNDKYVDYANDIHQSGAHLLRLINEVLDVARIESGKLTLSEDNFDLAALLANSLHLLAETALARRVFLARDIADDLPFMHGDPTRIQQIFNNLIGNAIKFTPAKGSVKVSAMALPDGALRVIVADTGIGIAPEDLSRVFETFGQVANDLTRAHEGAGLGLPLAKLLTEHHEGTLEIESQVGRGTTITVTFPASRAMPRQTAPKHVSS